MKNTVLLLAALALSSCGMIKARVPDSGPKYVMTVPAGTLPLAPGAISVSVLDQTTAEQALAPGTTGQELGTVSVALGSPMDQGFWLSTHLVATASKGRVVTATGQSLNLDLRPSQSGAILSYQAYKALGFALTDLPQVQVFGN